MTVHVDLGFWGESFFVDDDGHIGVAGCNGDRVTLDPEKWRRVIALLNQNLPPSPMAAAYRTWMRIVDRQSQKQAVLRPVNSPYSQTIPGRVTLTTRT